MPPSLLRRDIEQQHWPLCSSQMLLSLPLTHPPSRIITSSAAFTSHTHHALDLLQDARSTSSLRRTSQYTTRRVLQGDRDRDSTFSGSIQTSSLLAVTVTDNPGTVCPLFISVRVFLQHFRFLQSRCAAQTRDVSAVVKPMTLRGLLNENQPEQESGPLTDCVNNLTGSIPVKVPQYIR